MKNYGILDFEGSIFQQKKLRFLTESVSNLNLQCEDGILKVSLFVADERTYLGRFRGIFRTLQDLG